MVEDVVSVIADTLDIDKSKLDSMSKMNDVEGWDSLGQIKVILGIETKYNIKFAFEDIANLTSVDQIVAKLNEVLA